MKKILTISIICIMMIAGFSISAGAIVIKDDGENDPVAKPIGDMNSVKGTVVAKYRDLQGVWHTVDVTGQLLQVWVEDCSTNTITVTSNLRGTNLYKTGDIVVNSKVVISGSIPYTVNCINPSNGEEVTKTWTMKGSISYTVTSGILPNNGPTLTLEAKYPNGHKATEKILLRLPAILSNLLAKFI